MRSRFAVAAGLVLGLASLIAGCPSNTEPPPPPESASKDGAPTILISLKAAKMDASAAPSHSVDYVVSNNSRETQSVLNWNLATNGVWNDLFEVTDAAGNVLPYRGPVAKRGEPVEADFEVLPPGNSKVTTVDVSRYYDMRGGAEYTVKLRPQEVDVRSGPTALSAKREIVVSFDNAAVKTSAKAPVAAPFGAAKPITDKKANCDASQSSDLDTAQTNSQSMTRNARKDLSDNSAAAPSSKYKKWFGAPSAARYATITNNFAKIDGMVKGAMNFECKPKDCSSDSVYAYVFPTDATHLIHLCNAFWRAGQSGFDSKPGTLIHEASHFNDVADTDDIVYGTTRAAALAANEPDRAVKNADNHEYFAEDGT